MRDYQRESKEMAAVVADHLKIFEYNTSQCFSAADAKAFITWYIPILSP